ncbi:MAG: hypothetical protein ACR2FX_07520 [Chthoniobacterales bacterium]
MSLTISIPKSPDDLPLDPLLTLTRATLGLGLGLLVADRIKRPARQATAIALMSIGTLAAVPYLVKFTMGRFNRADSERGSRNRLRSIRDAGYHSESDAY